MYFLNNGMNNILASLTSMFIDGFTLNPNSVPESQKANVCISRSSKCRKKFIAVLEVDGYVLSIFNQMIKVSENYARHIFTNMIKSLNFPPGNSNINVKFQLVRPKAEVLDYEWNKRVSDLVRERQELDYTMSWLSTLGGAFSALGDNFENCAKVAGKISIQQFKIAFQLGENPLLARCRLYMALSLIQLGQLSSAKKLVQKQYDLAKAIKDVKLQNMCRGIWAKLQYVHQQQKIKHISQ